MQSVADDTTAGLEAIAVDPDIIGIKAPTTGPLCGRPSGPSDHRRRGERSCQECQEAYAEAYERWTLEAELKAQEQARINAARRPTMASILETAGLRDPEAVVAALKLYDYGDYADALLDAARECPVPTTNKTTGGAVKGWLRGRAAIIQKAL